MAPYNLSGVIQESSEATRSQIDWERGYVRRLQAVKLVHPHQMGCMLTLLA